MTSCMLINASTKLRRSSETHLDWLSTPALIGMMIHVAVIAVYIAA
jgi:hypothetical protein